MRKWAILGKAYHPLHGTTIPIDEGLTRKLEIWAEFCLRQLFSCCRLTEWLFCAHPLLACQYLRTWRSWPLSLAHPRVSISHFKSFQMASKEDWTVHRWCELNVSHQTPINFCSHWLHWGMHDCWYLTRYVEATIKWKGDLGKFVSVRVLGILAPVVSALIARQRSNLGTLVRPPENSPPCGFCVNCPLTPTPHQR